MMLMFWLIASAMTLCVVGLLLWPLLRRTTATAMGERENRLAVYRQQFAELEQDRKNGVLSDELYQQARQELERRLLDETGEADTAPTSAPWQVNSRLVAALLAIIIPTVSVALYWSESARDDASILILGTGSLDSVRESSEGIEALLERLKKNLSKTPTTEGLGTPRPLLCGIDRYGDAVTIYEKAVN
jgi:cytochrome c-type biogenesis protein CcmH